MGKKSSPKAPAAPDPVATAQAQSQYNKEAAVAQANLNRINQVTPQGSLTYTQTGTNSDGTPQYTQTQTLSADEQAKYDQQNKVALALGGLANDNIGRVAATQGKDFNFSGATPLKTSVDTSGLPALSTGPSSVAGAGGIQRLLDYSGLTKLPGTDDFSADAKRVQDAVYSQAASRLDPRFSQEDNDMKAALAAKGISENSDAYRRELDNFARAKNDAYQTAVNNSITAGSGEQSRLFNLALAARQQGKSEIDTQGEFANAAQQQQYAQNDNDVRFGAAAAALGNQTRAQGFNERAANVALNNSGRQQQISEETYLRNLPLNDIAALLGTGGGVNNPTFNAVSQVGVAAPDYQGAVYNTSQMQQNQYAQQQAARSAMLGSIFGTAGTIGAAAISDRRVKTAIRRVGKLASGIATYAFRYIGDKAQQFGVIAQEVANIRPHAVGALPNGILYVKYGEIF